MQAIGHEFAVTHGLGTSRSKGRPRAGLAILLHAGAALLSTLGAACAPDADTSEAPGTSAAGVSAFGTILAKNYSAMSGIQVDASGDVGYFDDGDWLEYDGVDFGSGITGITFTLGEDPQYAGSNIEVRLDSATGTLLGTLKVASTGSWSTFSTESTSLSTVTGVHNLVLVGRGGYGIADLRSFTFSAAASGTAYSPILAKSYNTMSGIQVDASGNVGYFDSGDWLSYGGVTFGATGAKSISFDLGEDPQYAGSQIEVRLDGATGTLVGALTVQPTGGWGTFADQAVNLSTTVTGTHTVYLVGKGGYGVANLHSFVFSGAAVGGGGGGGSSGNTIPFPGTLTNLTPSGPIAVSGKSGTVISGLKISNPNGPCITIDNSTNITIKGNEIGPCRTGVQINGGSSGITVNGNTIHDTVTYDPTTYEGNFDGPGVYSVSGVTGVTVSYNYMADVTTGYLAWSGSNLTFTHNFVKDVHGNGDRSVIDRVGGQMVQIGYSTAPIQVTCNQSDQSSGHAWTEDHVNLYGSRGTASNLILVAYNRVRGYGPSDSNGGLLAGDGDGSNPGDYIKIDSNNVIAPGGYGLGIAGGHNNVLSNNKVFGNCEHCSKGVYVHDFSSTSGFGGHLVQNNKVYFHIPSGNPWYGTDYDIAAGSATVTGNTWATSSSPSDVFGDGSGWTEASLWNQQFSACN